MKASVPSVDEIKKLLASNPSFSVEAMVMVYRCQTSSERTTGVTIEKNGVGFGAFDAELLTSFSQQVQSGRTLSARQMVYVFKKMPKYAKQVHKLLEAEVNAKWPELEPEPDEVYVKPEPVAFSKATCRLCGSPLDVQGNCIEVGCWHYGQPQDKPEPVAPAVEDDEDGIWIGG